MNKICNVTLPKPAIEIRGSQIFKPHEVMFNNYLISKGQVEISGASFSARLSEAKVGTGVIVYLSASQKLLSLYVELSFLKLLLPAANETQNIQDLSNNTLSILTELAISPFLKYLKQHENVDVQFTSAELVEVLPTSDMIWIEINNDYRVAVHDPNNLLMQFCKTGQQRHPQQTTLKISVEASLRASSIKMASEEFRKLVTGDGIILPSEWKPNCIDFLVIGRTQEIPLTYDGQKYKAQQPRQLDMGTPQMIYGDAIIEISLEIARSQMSITELSNIEEGWILPFDQEIGSEVRLVHHQEVLAVGEIIEIGDKYGIRITSLR